MKLFVYSISILKLPVTAYELCYGYNFLKTGYSSRAHEKVVTLTERYNQKDISVFPRSKVLKCVLKVPWASNIPFRHSQK